MTILIFFDGLFFGVAIFATFFKIQVLKKYDLVEKEKMEQTKKFMEDVQVYLKRDAELFNLVNKSLEPNK